MSNLHRLLSLGYFPRELPPTFSTKLYADAINSNLRSLPSSLSSGFGSRSVPSTYNLARSGSLRRKLSIPNPENYFLLCKYLVNNWANVNNHLQTCGLSISKPILLQDATRALGLKVRPSEIPAQRSYIRGTSRYLLKTDISKFYESIYTHSIPWATEGKARAKGNRAN